MLHYSVQHTYNLLNTSSGWTTFFLIKIMPTKFYYQQGFRILYLHYGINSRSLRMSTNFKNWKTPSCVINTVKSILFVVIRALINRNKCVNAITAQKASTCYWSSLKNLMLLISQCFRKFYENFFVKLLWFIWQIPIVKKPLLCALS